MKKLLLVLLTVSLMFVSSEADVKKGQKAYLKLFKTRFNMNGTRFAAEHTVAEWEELFANNAEGFIKEYGTRFPNAMPALDNINNFPALMDIGDFAKEYGSDSGNVPSCG